MGEWFEKNKGLPIAEQIKRDPGIQETSRRREMILPNVILSLGGELFYQQVFEPFQDHEPIAGSLSDDLVDIYLDIKEGLLAMEGSERVAANIIWQWKCDLEIHWGRHAVSAINALHCRFFSE